ncbi:hypothetical protein Hdeb2414_s0016g00482071 [Helianthus debilis subsp. tardiflorus]
MEVNALCYMSVFLPLRGLGFLIIEKRMKGCNELAFHQSLKVVDMQVNQKDNYLI